MSSSSFSDLTRQRDFMRLWSARLFSTIGSQMLMVAVGWLCRAPGKHFGAA